MRTISFFPILPTHFNRLLALDSHPLYFAATERYYDARYIYQVFSMIGITWSHTPTLESRLSSIGVNPCSSLFVPRPCSLSSSIWAFLAWSSWQNLLWARIRSPYLINANGMIVIPKLRKPSRLLAQGIPSLRYMGRAASGSTAPKMLRQQLVADMPLAAKIS